MGGLYIGSGIVSAPWTATTRLCSKFALVLLEPRTSRTCSSSPSQNTRGSRGGEGQSEGPMAGGSGQQSPVCVHVKDNTGREEGKAEL